MLIKRVLLIALLLFTLTALAGYMGSLHNWNNDSNSFKSVIAAAETGYKDNLAESMAWRDTGKMIKEARKLYKSGKNVAALILANKAYKQTVNATLQTILAKTAGPRF
ncbi:hypothetical protein [Candidatus Vesicomyidisocius sp. SY067_SCS001]|uniref:hypothetical protein n=1 Tax=Candidatus Vesicomyidisocius sp. SY067_SCS001 TaxID=2732590 RepID=UPI001EEE851B|nr:hypothetical protein [Candidatus Vesicomyosocius sp. SY067_SCS001]